MPPSTSAPATTRSPSATSPTPPPSPTPRPSPAAPATTPSPSAPASPPRCRSISAPGPTSSPSPPAATPARVSNVNTLIGGSGADAVTYATALVNGSVDLGAGSDTLQLANFTNTVSLANTETTLGGTGNDTITLTSSGTSAVVGGAGMNFITGNTGADEFVLDQSTTGNLMYGYQLQRGQGGQDRSGYQCEQHFHPRYLRPWRCTPHRQYQPQGGSRRGNATDHKRGDWRQRRFRLPTKHRRTVLQRQRQLCWWRNACGRDRQQHQHPMDLQRKQLHASLIRVIE